MRRSIRVRQFSNTDKLDKMARVNYAKIYSVEHNVKVYDFGQVHKDDEVHLIHDFYDAWGFSGGLPPPRLDTAESTGHESSTMPTRATEEYVQRSDDDDDDDDDAEGEEDEEEADSDGTEKAEITADSEEEEEVQALTSKGKGKRKI
jgi:hypothetical protein